MRVHWTLLLMIFAGLVLLGGAVGCRTKPGGVATGGAADATPSAPKESRSVTLIRRGVGPGSPEAAREKAVDAFVRGWPSTRAALPAVLELLRWDGGNRGAYAMSLARLGKALAPVVNAMVAEKPGDKPTILAAGVLAYHLVVRGGVTKRAEAEFEEIRRALRPSFEYFWKAFLSDLVPEGEIYQGVAVGAEEAVGRFRPPFPPKGLTRVAMVLYFALSRIPDQAVVPPVVRKRLRQQAAPLAAFFAPALATAGQDPTGESPDSLVLGLAVLGTASAVALSQTPALHRPERCPVLVKALSNLVEQSGARAAALAAGLLEGCARQTTNPAASAQARTLLAALRSKASPNPSK
ncbi:MAG: hypothetical protein ABI333_27615 [bacterium]